MAISKSKLPARDVCERCLWQIQRAIRSGSGQNLVSDSEQQILGTTTEDCHSRKRLRNDKILLCLLLIET